MKILPLSSVYPQSLSLIFADSLPDLVDPHATFDGDENSYERFLNCRKKILIKLVEVEK